MPDGRAMPPRKRVLVSTGMGERVHHYAQFTACVSLLALACSSGAAVPPNCVPYVSDANLASPVSFNESIVPIFQRNCASTGGTCHGDVNSLPRLGSADGGIDAAIVRASIVGVVSIEDPTMDFVAAGNPERSYLMHKMDGDECTLAAECAASSDELSNCGSSMPFLQPLLPVATRDMVRAWIGQGASGD
jgi:hypothetical protein